MNNLLKNSSKFIGVFLFTLLVAFTISAVVPMDAIGIESTATVEAAAKLNKTSVSLPKGGSTQLSVSGTSKKVTWKSNNTGVATVNSKGKVSAKKAGKATITAKVNGKTYKCTVKVVSFKSNASAITMTKGKTYSIKITGTSNKVTYKSKKTAIATVTAKGKVTAKKKGSTTITVKAGKETLSIPVTVETPSISKKKVTVNKGKSTTLKVNGTSRTVKWSSNNKTVATVNSKGKVTAKGSGQAIITAKLNDKSYTCVVTVGTPVFSGLPDSVTVAYGSTKSYTLTVKAHVDMSVLRDDPSICKWEANPTSYYVGDKIKFDFIGLKPGTTNITFTAENGWKKVIPVTVTGVTVPNSSVGASYDNFTVSALTAYIQQDSTTPDVMLTGTIKNNNSRAVTSVDATFSFYDASGNLLFSKYVYWYDVPAGQTLTLDSIVYGDYYSSTNKVARVEITDICASTTAGEAVDGSDIILQTNDSTDGTGISISNFTGSFVTSTLLSRLRFTPSYTLTNTTAESKSFYVYYDIYDENGVLIPQKYPPYEYFYLDAGEVYNYSSSSYENVTGALATAKFKTIKLRIELR